MNFILMNAHSGAARPEYILINNCIINAETIYETAAPGTSRVASDCKYGSDCVDQHTYVSNASKVFSRFIP